MYGHHPSIINKFKQRDLCCLVPFLLWHKTGCTVTLCDYIEHIVGTGLTIQLIESRLLANRIDLFYSMKVRYEKLSKFNKISDQTTNCFPDVNDCNVSFHKQSPTRHAIASFFLFRFWQNEPAYTCKMGSLTTGYDCVWLSCDHTFSSVCNV